MKNLLRRAKRKISHFEDRFLNEIITSSYMTAISLTTIGKPVIPLFFDSDPSLLEGCRFANVHVCLDYDGTLTPIVNDPSAAYLPDDIREAVIQLASVYPVSIVTGRGRMCVSQFLGEELINKVSLAASHGFDIHLQTGEYHHMGENHDMRDFEQFKQDLRSSISEFPRGCVIEENKYSVSLHYRNVHENEHLLAERLLDELLLGYRNLVKREGKMVFEVRLGLDWNKGKAVEWILNRTNLDPKNCFVIYLGDDITDEDAFYTLRNTYPFHLSLIVASDGSLNRPTSADFRLRDQTEVLKFLLKLIEVRKKHC